jgi:hypothetical protein
MNCILVTKSCKNKAGHIFEAGNLYYTALEAIPADQQSFLRLIDLDKHIARLNGNVDNKVTHIIMFRTGGIGDIIAMSCICNYYYKQNIIFVTQAQYLPIFDWFVLPVNFADINGIIFKNFNKRFKFGAPNFRRFWVEGLIEAGDRTNWCELMFMHAGFEEVNTTLLRPGLRLDRASNAPSNLTHLARKYKKILIINKASVMHRSIEATEIIEALLNTLDLTKPYKLFVYQNNLSDNDIDYSKFKNITPAFLNNIKALKPTNLETHLLDLYDADLVISVDTAAIHFREGIRKPAIGLYNSFSVESRTKYYLFTKSYDITSDCEMQPCFIHCKSEKEFCPKVTAWQFSAPCVRSDSNPTLQEQLIKIFTDNLNLF